MSVKYGVVFHYLFLRFNHNEEECRRKERKFRAKVKKNWPSAVEIKIPPQDGKDPGWSLFLFEKEQEAKYCCYSHRSWHQRGVLEKVGEIRND